MQTTYGPKNRMYYEINNKNWPNVNDALGFSDDLADRIKTVSVTTFLLAFSSRLEAESNELKPLTNSSLGAATFSSDVLTAS
jgi:hypothetical protein